MHHILLRSLLLMQSLDEEKTSMRKFKKKLSNQKAKHCRVCNKRRICISIFHNSYNINVAEEILHFSGVKVQKTDTASKSICKPCLTLLEGCIQFRDVCRDTNEYLPNVVLDVPISEIKKEPKVSVTKLEVEIEVDENYSLPSPTFSEIFNAHNCPVCNMPFPDLETCNAHKEKCDGTGTPQLTVSETEQEPKKEPKKKFLCDTCGITSSTQRTLNMHMTIHSNIFPFACTTCPYKGKTKDLLKAHQRSHMKVKPYKCPFCPQACSSASNLAKHKNIKHSTERPFKCPECDRRFAYKSDVAYHVKEIHLRESTSECPICRKVFVTRKRMRYHRLKVHKVRGERTGPLPSYLQCQQELQEEQAWTGHSI